MLHLLKSVFSKKKTICIDFVSQDAKILAMPSEIDLKRMERIARISHKSQDKITNDSYLDLLQRVSVMKHESVFEFADMTVEFVTSRAIANEMVRHRLCSFMQESTRYINFEKKNDHKIPIINNTYTKEAINAFNTSALAYFKMLKDGVRPEDARDVLPLALATTIVLKANIREWAYIFNMRLINKKTHHMFRRLLSLLYLQVVHTKTGEQFSNIFKNVYGISISSECRNVLYGIL